MPWRVTDPSRLGRIRVADCAESSARIEEDECSTCQGLPQVGRGVRTRETQCWGLGDCGCTFEIAADLDVHA